MSRECQKNVFRLGNLHGESVTIHQNNEQGHFQPYSGWAFSGLLTDGGGPIPKICQTYPTMMKLGTVMLYPKKIQIIYESRDTPLEFCWDQHFFTGYQQILLYQEIQI